jgi:hypothetical protein
MKTSRRAFAVTWDYRCPFARNAHEHVVVALRDGAPWDVTFVPFSLTQVHVGEGELDAWDNPTKADTLLALEAGVVVRDRMPERFLDAHLSLFSVRHDDGLDLREAGVVRDALDRVGVDGAAVIREIEAGWPLAQLQKEHTEAADNHHVWGVPTFIAGDQASFVRLTNRPGDDAALARRTIERVVDLLGDWPELNEFKHTSISR